jgi:hypothetical protein
VISKCQPFDPLPEATRGGAKKVALRVDGGHQDPRHPGKHPGLKGEVITPDIVLQPHNASLEMTF